MYTGKSIFMRFMVKIVISQGWWGLIGVGGFLLGFVSRNLLIV